MAETFKASDFHIPHEVIVDGMVLASSQAETIPGVQALETTEKDILLATYPRSGTTWMGEVISLLQHRGDAETMLKTSHENRVYYLEYHYCENPEVYQYDGLQLALSHAGESRILKTHFPFKYMGKQIGDHKTKTVVVMRNVRDVVVSMYHFYSSIPEFNFKGTWGQFFELFREKRLLYGDWLDHLKSYWEMRHFENMHVIFYEDAVDDLDVVVHDLARFLNIDLSSDERKAVVDNSTFASMKKKAKEIMVGDATLPDDNVLVACANDIIRKGSYGGWRKYFSPEQDEYVRKTYDLELEKIGLKFKN